MRGSTAVPWHDSLDTFSKVVKGEKDNLSFLSCATSGIMLGAHLLTAAGLLPFPCWWTRRHRLSLSPWASPAFLFILMLGVLPGFPKISAKMWDVHWCPEQSVSEVPQSAQMYVKHLVKGRAVLIPCLLSHTEPKSSSPYFLWDSQHIGSPGFFPSVSSVQHHCSFLGTLKTPQEHLDVAVWAPTQFLAPSMHWRPGLIFQR